MFGFNDPFGLNNQINSMINNQFMMDPFGAQQQINSQQQRNSRGNGQSGSVAQRGGHADPFGSMLMSPFQQQHNAMMQQNMMMSNPFAMMNQMMGGMGGMGGGFNNMIQGNTIHADPSSQVFSSSSVTSYSNSGTGGKPKIFQQSTEMRQGPGGVKETRQMLRDTERGIEKVSVGHHIGDRAHVIEKQRLNGSEFEEIVNLENLDDDEVNQFNQEFEHKIRNGHNGHHQHHQNHRSHAHSINNNAPFAIEDGRSSKKERSDRKTKSSNNPSRRSDK